MEKGTLIMKGGCFYNTEKHSNFWHFGRGRISNKDSQIIIKLRDVLFDITLISHDKESKRTLSGTASATILGTIAMGPLGGIAGAVYGGQRDNKDNVVFIATFNDGRKFIAETQKETYLELLGYIPSEQTTQNTDNEKTHGSDKQKYNLSDIKECPMCAETIKLKAKVCRFCGYSFSNEEITKSIELSKKKNNTLNNFKEENHTENQEDKGLYKIVFYGEIQKNKDIGKVKESLQKFYNVNREKIKYMFLQDKVVLKKNLHINKAKKYKDIFEKNGAICKIEEM